MFALFITRINPSTDLLNFFIKCFTIFKVSSLNIKMSDHIKDQFLEENFRDIFFVKTHNAVTQLIPYHCIA